MKKPYRVFLYLALSITLLILIAGVFAKPFLENILEGKIKESLPDHLKVSYTELNLHLLSGSAVLERPIVSIANKGNKKVYATIVAKTLNIESVSYWNYFFRKRIKLAGISIVAPEVVYYKTKKEQDTIEKQEEVKDLVRKIDLKNFNFKDGTFTIVDDQKDSIALFVNKLNFDVSDIRVDDNSLKEKIPFWYKDYHLAGDSLFAKVGQYENLSTGSFVIDQTEVSFDEIAFFTKYSIVTLNNIIPYERDHYELYIPLLKIHDYEVSFPEESFKTSASKLIIDRPDFKVYRDKTVEKDTTFKPLYNRSLRELSFALGIDSLEINSAQIQYTERQHEENVGGIISFKDLNAKIANVGNVYKTPIDAHITALFMKETPLQVHWILDVHSPVDHFVFKGELQEFKAPTMNAFTMPNVNAELEGIVNHTYFTIDGNNEKSSTQVKIKYHDLKVDFLKKDRQKKRFLSAIVNLIVPNNSDKNQAEYAEGEGEADRNKNQSVFNQLWISLESALKDVIL